MTSLGSSPQTSPRSPRFGVAFALSALSLASLGSVGACSAGGGADVVESAGGAAGLGGAAGTGGSASAPGTGGAGKGGAPAAAGTGGSAGAAVDPGSIADEACEDDDGEGWPAESRALECQVLTLINERRTAGVDCGGTAMPAVAPVHMHTALRKAARALAADMAQTGSFSHTSSDGKTTPDRLKDAGYSGAKYGENIANGQKTAEGVLTSWLASASQCKVLMNADYQDLGVGLARNAADETYWVADVAGK